VDVANPAIADGPIPSREHIADVYSWASQIASEERDLNWINHWYVRPDAVRRIQRLLENMRGGIIGLVGRQGVGKSSALQAIYVSRMETEEEERKTLLRQKRADSALFDQTLLFKWRREPELFKSLLDETHELSSDYNLEYRRIVWERVVGLPQITDAEKYEQRGPGTLDLRWAETKLGRSVMQVLRREAWLRILLSKKLLLIDTPDYSKTDRRLMARDLEGIYWLWNFIIQHNKDASIVVAIQKEMFRDHFFFDKMDKIELEPLRPDQMVQAYLNRFGSTTPFTREGLLTVARMSRGIFRRFLRYITLALRLWETSPEPRDSIGLEIVRKAIATERLAEDMEFELAELFPKHSDLRLQAVRLLMHLQEYGPTKQSELGQELGMERYMMSRLLTRLELHHYVTRERARTDKIVSLTETE